MDVNVVEKRIEHSRRSKLKILYQGKCSRFEPAFDIQPAFSGDHVLRSGYTLKYVGQHLYTTCMLYVSKKQ